MALPSGLHSEPKIFNAVADAVEWFARQKRTGPLLHYLDHILTMGEPDSPDGSVNLTILLSVLKYPEIPVTYDKLEGTSTRVMFIGIEIDMVAMELSLPERKPWKLQELTQDWLERHPCMK